MHVCGAGRQGSYKAPLAYSEREPRRRWCEFCCEPACSPSAARCATGDHVPLRVFGILVQAHGKRVTMNPAGEGMLGGGNTVIGLLTKA